MNTVTIEASLLGQALTEIRHSEGGYKNLTLKIDEDSQAAIVRTLLNLPTAAAVFLADEILNLGGGSDYGSDNDEDGAAHLCSLDSDDSRD